MNKTPNALLALSLFTSVAAAPPPAVANGSTPPPVRRTTEASMDQQVTAKDLIGREIYDRQNKHIGQIVDVALGGIVPEELKNALAQSDRDGYAASGVAPLPGNNTGRQQQSDPAKASDRELDDQPKSNRVHASATSTVFIAVGGVLGIGADLIRAPLSALSFDRRHNRIILDLSSEQLRSLLKSTARPASTSRAATIVYESGR